MPAHIPGDNPIARENTTPIKATDCAHLRLTVTDVDRSRAFHGAVFGVEAAYEAPPEDADQTMEDQLAFLFGA